uniref:Uncharacterized protein n=1 Tax=Arundo donax TaxID=35708 RepID=A0A0A8ZKM5_ARUDO
MGWKSLGPSGPPVNLQCSSVDKGC